MSRARVLPLHRPVDHRQAEPRAAFAFGREERLEAAPPRLLVHTDTRVADIEADDPLCRTAGGRRCRRKIGSQYHRATSGMASTALKIRLISASRISLGTAGHGR
jgi:hypothetical protein